MGRDRFLARAKVDIRIIRAAGRMASRKCR